MNQLNALTINHLTVAYTDRLALDDISVTVPAGVVCAVIGPNGAGKSTLLKAILGLIKPLAGTILIFDKLPAEVHGSIAYVPQRIAVDWHFPISVFDVVMMGRYTKSFWWRPTEQDKHVVNEALSMVGMFPFAQHLIGELSGGQQQRVFLARALAQQRSLIVLDEPFNGVDAATEQLIIQVLKLLVAQGVTVLIVDHGLSAVSNYADWVIQVRTQLIQAGPVTILNSGNIPHNFFNGMHNIEKIS